MILAVRILALPHVMSLEDKGGTWLCRLHPGLTTKQMHGASYAVGESLREVWDSVKGRALPAQRT